ncbi:PQQ-binding-like beta-propeller repeat protein [Streptomyces sp. NPDC090057]|uniref:serine/threonine-protein kinase n=1 Tax=Streptomyces sp. NPDC090057 TaxID=3365935 RepID=UPI0037F9F9E5
MLSPLTHEDPARIAAHQLLARLGSGGMGTVYLARTPTGRTAALKTMHPRIAADPASRTRFRLEIDAARVIGGRYGAQVFDADPLAPTPWLATEYVIGPPLGDAVGACGPLPEPAVRALGATLCEALGQLHSSDVVHRDLKPSNIMVTADGPRLIDFGIARAAGDEHLTRTGTAAGTPAYMSPEQAMGHEHEATGDVFALAGVLVFAATGRAPFGSGQAADLLYRVRYAEPDLSRVPPALVPVFARCLAKDPSQRPATAELRAHLATHSGEFTDVLPQPLLDEIGRRATAVWLPAPPRLPAPAPAPHEPTVTSGSSTGSSGPSRRRLLALGGGSLLAVAAAGAGAWSWWDRADREQAPSAVWRTTFTAPASEERAAPLVVGDRLVVNGSSGVRAFDVATGDPSWSSGDLAGPWRTAADGSRMYGLSPAGSNPYAFTVSSVGPADGSFTARAAMLDKWAGGLRYERLLCVADDKAFAVAGVKTRKQGETQTDGPDTVWSLLAADLGRGEAVWDLSLGRTGSAGQTYVMARVVGESLIICGKGSSGPYIASYNASYAHRNWSVRVAPDELRSGHGELAADDRNIYLGGDALRARSLSTGKTVWSFKRSGTAFGAPVVVDGVVYAGDGTGSGGLVAVDAANGRLIWRESDPPAPSPRFGPAPVVGQAHVYRRSADGIVAVDRSSHKAAWTFRTDATDLTASPSHRLLFAVAERSVVALPFA